MRAVRAERSGPGALTGRAVVLSAGLALGVLAATPTRAGGTPENAILIIDPANAVSLQIGNYYKRARNIPDRNIFYIDSTATTWANFAAAQQKAFQSTIAQRGLTSLADYAIVSPCDTFRIPAVGVLTDACWPANNIGVANAYGMSFMAEEILTANPKLSVETTNRFFGSAARWFDSESAYVNGTPNTSANARRYYLGALLGWTGQNGNTVAEIRAMIDRSVGADGTRPGGTFAFQNNTADPDRNVRTTQYSGVISAINSLGGTAAQFSGVLPPNGTVAAGIMTGAQTIDLTATGITLVPGAFADHLTSWAATFDINQQTKVSYWIRNGASGSSGSVDEPCNYTGKFPHARIHQFLRSGLSHGEAFWRSLAYIPFQNEYVGDPLTRPWAYFPTLSVTGVPAGGGVSGVFTITPSAAPTAPGTGGPTPTISAIDVVIDGARVGGATNNQAFTVNSYALDEGYHDLRVLAYDSTAARNVGRWVQPITVNNLGRSAGVTATPSTGDLATQFTFGLSAAGSGLAGAVKELRLVQNERVLAARADAGPVQVYGQALGAGTSRVFAEAIFADGRVMRSQPLDVAVGVVSAGGTAQPVAYSYTKRMGAPGDTVIVELPASFDADLSTAVFTLVTNPTKATVISVPGAAGTGPVRFMTVNAGASGRETMTFRVTTAGGTSNVGTITLDYSGRCLGDLNGDGQVDDLDFVVFAQEYDRYTSAVGDFNADGVTDDMDFVIFAQGYDRFACP